MDDEKAKAEKLAAAKKRVEQMKKAKAKKAGGSTTAAKKDGAADAPAPSPKEPDHAEDAAAQPAEEDTPVSPTTTAPSLAQQSKARSASFLQGTGGGPLSPGPFSPDGETAPDIYRKHVMRIEELEKENKRLSKEAQDAEKRWQKAEEELADLREVEGGEGTKGEGAGGIEKLRNEITALQRQNAQLQAQVSRGGPGTRHGSSPSVSMASPAGELEAQLQSKSATIETMELEMSRLRAQVERLSVSASTPSEQIAALEEKLARAEKAAALAQRELTDLKRNLERATEKAVKEGSERTSAETKLRALERENAEVVAARDELAKKVDALEKKVATLTTLHKEQDGRTQTLRKDKERVDKEVAELKQKIEKVEADNFRLRKKDAAEGGGDDEGVDELENEGRLRLEKRVRELEAENSDLRRGIWHEKRKEMQVGPDDAARFENVDLGGSPWQRKAPSVGGGIGDFFTSGLNALTGTGHEELLEDDDMEFDEEAFRRAQEEDQKKRIERIKDIKRGLKNWEGWRLDLVENRRGGGEGIGEIFEV
ncbi:USO1-intracellular transport [Echria macrotheca]|uniref:USO1-intracellular transport n=1 Tax=Echria macrotheca TaxID=438768 RepID=A0AAJ0F4D2_9PEZI|nr:USO1-intracellular transport [Echria macrotheca]